MGCQRQPLQTPKCQTRSAPARDRRTTPIRPQVGSDHMEDVKQDDDRDRDPEQPQQNWTHDRISLTVLGKEQGRRSTRYPSSVECADARYFLPITSLTASLA